MQFSPQDLAFLRDQFIEATAEAIAGTTLTIGSLPPNRLSAPVPANLLAEADPVALPAAQAAQAAADAAQADVDALAAVSNAGFAGTTSSLGALDTRVSAVEARAPDYEQAVLDAQDWMGSALRPVSGLTKTFAILDGDGVTTHTLEFVAGLLVSHVET
jgi:hypothetical protein